MILAQERVLTVDSTLAEGSIEAAEQFVRVLVIDADGTRIADVEVSLDPETLGGKYDLSIYVTPYVRCATDVTVRPQAEVAP